MSTFAILNVFIIMQIGPNRPEASTYKRKNSKSRGYSRLFWFTAKL